MSRENSEGSSAGPFRHTGIVDRYPGDKGWYFLSVPNDLVEPIRHLADRGLIPIVATVGATSWKTSLLPKGDGTLFVALNASVRKTEQIELGDEIEVAFELRRE